MESSRRDLFIDMVVRFIFKNNQITLFPCFTLTPKTGVRLRKTGVSLYYLYAQFILRSCVTVMK